MSGSEAVVRSVGGDGGALTMPMAELEQFFQQHFPIVRAKCRRMLGDSEEATDIAQEAFLRLWRSPAAGEGPAVRAKFMYVTATRLVIDYLRRRRLGVEVGWSDAVAARPGSGGAGAEGVAAARQALARLAAELDARSLEAVVYSRYDRMSHDEVASVMGLSSRQVRRILDSVDRKLERRRELAPHDG
jgi:RNA polymerase sigma-70 factor (ECF subfamily)